MKRFTGLIFTASFLFIFCQTDQENKPQSDKNHIIKHITVYAAKSEYLAWPDIVRAKNGDLIVAACRSEEHVGPDGQIITVRSSDNGETWNKPEILYDSVADDRESGLTILKDGTIIANMWTTHHTRKNYLTTYKDGYDHETLVRWGEFVNKPEYKNASAIEGRYVSFSTDNGLTWSKPEFGPESIHGGIELQNGTILVASYRKGGGNILFFSAENHKGPWKQGSIYEVPQTDSLRFGEPHILQLASGRIIMMLRSTAKPYDDQRNDLFLWETYSDDNGKTWAEAYPTPLWGFPPHLLQLSDGRILCTYGHRRPPYGQRACISSDGLTWKKEDEFILRDDAYNKDLGYPASVELEPGKILSIYYQPDPADGPQKMDPPDLNRSRPDILGTVWKLPPVK